MPDRVLPRFPFGAVYFRKSNPPREDWERDYQTAAEDGMNTFRHWFIWSAIEVAPGTYDWKDYDRQLDLAAKNGIKTIIAEMMTLAPEWAWRKYAHARYERNDGSKVTPHMNVSCATGGSPGLCLDNEDAKEAAERFLRALVERYKDHPGLGGYDIWNECNISANVCYCPATVEKFRAWLKAKYDDLKTLGEAWHRYSFAGWEDVEPPRQLGPYPDTLDWLEFRIDNAYRHLRWRAELIRELDPIHPVTAHGIAASLTGMAPRSADDWRAAAEVDSYGYTWGSSRHGDEPWKQWHAVDLVRASSRGKPFWHAEAYGGPLWMQPQVVGKPRNQGRIARPEDIRLWKLQSFAAGATGVMFLRWRPLLDGPLFGAFGPYGMDGSRTPRSEIVSRIAKWTMDEAQADLWRSRPVKGEVGIVFVPESQLHCYAQQGETGFFADSLQGAYQGFFDNNIQADWVHIDHIDEYDFLYLPYPVMLKKETAKKLVRWVERGGNLVCEGCPAYFGDRGKVGTVQPNYGLDALFGARETWVEFTPDLLDDLLVNVAGREVRGGTFMQAYDATTGTPAGWYPDGRIAAVDHAYGKGRTRLIGTFPGAGYARHPADPRESRTFFADLLSWAGKSPHVRIDDPRLTARLHDGVGGTYLWITNPTEGDLPVTAALSEAFGPFQGCEALWPEDASVKIADGRTVRAWVGRRDGLVLRLRP